MTAGETVQIEANMTVVHNIMNGSDEVSQGGSWTGHKLQVAA